LVTVPAISRIDHTRRPLPPYIERLDPDTGRPGDLITAYGRSLDRRHVEDLCLTDSQRYLLVRIVEQSETFIRFRIPPQTRPGRYAVLICPGGELDQSVTLTVK
jgi:hypothetical protein